MKAGLAGAFTAGLFGGVHDMPVGLGKVFAHGVIGGASAALQGGSFKDGFVGAAVSQGVWQGVEKFGGTGLVMGRDLEAELKMLWLLG